MSLEDIPDTAKAKAWMSLAANPGRAAFIHDVLNNRAVSLSTNPRERAAQQRAITQLRRAAPEARANTLELTEVFMNEAAQAAARQIAADVAFANADFRLEESVDSETSTRS